MGSAPWHCRRGALPSLIQFASLHAMQRAPHRHTGHRHRHELGLISEALRGRLSETPSEDATTTPPESPSQGCTDVTLIRSARWVGLSQATRVGLQVLGLLILPRLLSPHDYGLVAMATTVTNLAFMFRDFGTASALIQKKDLRPETVDSVFWLTCTMGVGLGLIVAACAPLAASLFKSPDLTPLLIILALAFPVIGSTAVHQALLERDSKFPMVAKIEVAAAALGFTTTIASAYLGAGAYALLAQTLVAAAFTSICLWVSVPWRPRLAFSREELRHIGSFSSNLFFFNLINYLSRNADAIVIGRLLGSSALGAYSLAYRVMVFPFQNLTSVAARVMLPSLSKRGASVEETERLFARLLRLVAFLTAPMMAGLFAVRHVFVAVMFGDKWNDVAAILGFLAPIGIVQAIVGLGGTALMAMGRTDTLFRLGLLGGTLQVCAFFIGARWGVVGVAAAYCIASTVNSVPAMFYSLRTIGSPRRILAHSLPVPVACAAGMAGIVMLFDLLVFDGTALASVIRLGTLVLVGLAAYAMLTLAFQRTVLNDTIQVFVKKVA